ncbi:phenylacetate--CoA ligase family protein [Piscinibacter sp.]|uniref:phenylacetate--CoA ligase family protein n=1 Tax=Piscinibacter sp. TaxID=1903157 RepID=UPI002F409CDD
MSTPYDPWRAGAISLDIVAVARATAQGLQRRQAQRLAALVDVAAERSPLYRKLLGPRSAAPVPLDALPVTTKSNLMQHFDEWVTDPRLRLSRVRRFIDDPRRVGQTFLERYVVWESSGSSGEPGVFVQDEASLEVCYALEALRRRPLQPARRGWDPCYLAERLAFVGATTGHFASVVSVERLRHLNPWVAASTHSFSFLQSTAALVEQLNRYAPTIVATYPTAALLLSEEAMAGRLRIAPNEIWTGGETLTDAERRQVAERFGCPVSSSYGASEFLSLASECRFGRLHLNSDWAILESVDAQGRPVPAGAAGHTVLLTNLANHVQPLIRYDLGDRVTFAAAPCRCGSALPAIEVDGRADDSVLLRDEQGHDVRLLPLALTTVLEDRAGVYNFQLEQEDANSLLLRVAAAGSAGESALRRARTALRSYLCEQGLPQVRLHGHCGAPSRRGASGKVQRVVGLASH